MAHVACDSVSANPLAYQHTSPPPPPIANGTSCAITNIVSTIITIVAYCRTATASDIYGSNTATVTANDTATACIVTRNCA